VPAPEQVKSADVAQTGASGPAMPAIVVTPSKGSGPTTEVVRMDGKLPGDMVQHLATLQYGVTPEERQAAAENLGASPWCSHPEVMQVLTAVSREDPAVAVRAACLRGLARVNYSMQGR
jgi:hypothetical protein